MPPSTGRFGNNGSFVVPGRRKCSDAVNGGHILSPRGPLMHPKPSTSTRLAHRKAFWNAVPSKIHEVKFHGVPSPGVKLQKNIQPSTKRSSLTAWKRYTASG